MSFLFLLGVALLEFLHATRAVDKLLLAGKKRVAAGADFHADVLLGGARVNHVAAHASDRGIKVLGMYFLFHQMLLFFSFKY